MKIIVIGDVHGCFRTFQALLRKLPKNSLKILVGDFIDRGPRSKEMVDYLIAHPEIKSVKGNHEVMALNDKNKQYQDLWILNGGKESLDSGFGEEAHYEYLKSLPDFIEIEDYLVVSHSGDIRDCWNRKCLYPQQTKRYHIFGHTPTKGPIIKKRYANIDTGCVFNYLGMGVLTAIELPSMKIHTQENID